MSITDGVIGFALAFVAIACNVEQRIAMEPASAKAGHLIMQTGRTELLQGQIILEVRQSKDCGLTVGVTRKLPDS